MTYDYFSEFFARTLMDMSVGANFWSPSSANPAPPPAKVATPVSHPAPKPTKAAPLARGEPAPTRAAAQSHFVTHAFSNAKGSRDYLLFVPSGYVGQSMPLIVMLHGCQQDPRDFAAGTRMNLLAERHGFLVAYPCQTYKSNGANCWNWYEPAEQTRDGQEPSLIVGIVDAIGQRFAVDRTRVFVAGLSAGASMAVILGQTYPDVFAAVAAHSGMPRGVAQDVHSAFAAMQGKYAADAREPLTPAPLPVRTLVIHGDADQTVSLVNGQAITKQALAAYKRAKVPMARDPGDGRRTPRTPGGSVDFVALSGDVMVREYIVPGGAHAWFGGSEEGSFTQPGGPSASVELVRFFLGHASSD